LTAPSAKQSEIGRSTKCAGADISL
jgi:hypothetical protein